MDLISQLEAVPVVGHLLLVAVAAYTTTVTVAAHVAQFLPPPKVPTGAYSIVYQVVNILARNVGQATNANTPNPKEP